MADDYIWEAISRQIQRDEKRFLLIMNILRRLDAGIVQEEIDKLYPKNEEES